MTLSSVVTVITLCAPLAIAAYAEPVVMPTTAMSVTVQERLRPQTRALMEQLMKAGRDLKIDAQPVFIPEASGGDKFLSGKIALGMAELILSTPRDDPDFGRYLQGFRDLSRLTIDDGLATWGIYYYLSALQRLKAAGVLEQAVDADVLEKLQRRLDWRGFVKQPDMTLIGAPNNYYGVAFSIAQLRYRLGWEDDAAAKALLEKMLAHYRTYSDYGFADELEGQGRFDRYSILLIGEIAKHHIDAGLEPSPEVCKWLRASADLILLRLNPEGSGFEYGRSIGVYGETAFVEVLSTAAYFNVLTPEEKDAAYSFSALVAQRYMDFWVDSETGSVNLWDHGRRTDAYRGKHRILGENLSLSQQLIYTSALWEKMGYKGRAPVTDFTAWRRNQPEMTTTWFARGQYDRALITRRDRDRVFGLALINGGGGQHMHSPYFPLPFSQGVVEGAADGAFPQLISRFTLKDGTVLQPLSYFKNVEVSGRKVSYRQTELDRMGKSSPEADTRISAQTIYEFGKGRVTRSDRFMPVTPIELKSMDIEFASFSDAPSLKRIKGGWQVNYANGVVTSFELEGFNRCEISRTSQPLYRTPTGPFKTLLRCANDAFVFTTPVKIKWTLVYK